MKEQKLIDQKDVREQVRLAITRLLRDALELNDRQLLDEQLRIEVEKDIMEDAELIFDYFKLHDIDGLK